MPRRRQKRGTIQDLISVSEADYTEMKNEEDLRNYIQEEYRVLREIQRLETQLQLERLRLQMPYMYGITNQEQYRETKNDEKQLIIQIDNLKRHLRRLRQLLRD